MPERPYRAPWWLRVAYWLGLVEGCDQHDVPLRQNKRLVCPVCGKGSNDD